MSRCVALYKDVPAVIQFFKVKIVAGCAGRAFVIGKFRDFFVWNARDILLEVTGKRLKGNHRLLDWSRLVRLKVQLALVISKVFFHAVYGITQAADFVIRQIRYIAGKKTFPVIFFGNFGHCFFQHLNRPDYAPGKKVCADYSKCDCNCRKSKNDKKNVAAGIIDIADKRIRVYFQEQNSVDILVWRAWWIKHRPVEQILRNIAVKFFIVIWRNWIRTFFWKSKKFSLYFASVTGVQVWYFNPAWIWRAGDSCIQLRDFRLCFAAAFIGFGIKFHAATENFSFGLLRGREHWNAGNYCPARA